MTFKGSDISYLIHFNLVLSVEWVRSWQAYTTAANEDNEESLQPASHAN